MEGRYSGYILKVSFYKRYTSSLNSYFKKKDDLYIYTSILIGCIVWNYKNINHEVYI